jgi:predicted RND superfamily exporter protein
VPQKANSLYVRGDMNDLILLLTMFLLLFSPVLSAIIAGISCGIYFRSPVKGILIGITTAIGSGLIPIFILGFLLKLYPDLRKSLLVALISILSIAVGAFLGIYPLFSYFKKRDKKV